MSSGRQRGGVRAHPMGQERRSCDTSSILSIPVGAPPLVLMAQIRTSAQNPTDSTPGCGGHLLLMPHRMSSVGGIHASICSCAPQQCLPCSNVRSRPCTPACAPKPLWPARRTSRPSYQLGRTPTPALPHCNGLSSNNVSSALWIDLSMASFGRRRFSSSFYSRKG